MLRFPAISLGPFWLEDLTYFTIDEMRRLPMRAKQARTWIEAHLTRETVSAAQAWLRRTLERGRPVAIPPPSTTRLAEPEEWSLATEAVTAADATTTTAVALHRAAAEQLDALTYVLDRMRDDVRPLMTSARFADETVHQLPEADQLEASLQALLELSRQNAATRPKRYAQTAA